MFSAEIIGPVYGSNLLRYLNIRLKKSSYIFAFFNEVLKYKNEKQSLSLYFALLKLTKCQSLTVLYEHRYGSDH